MIMWPIECRAVFRFLYFRGRTPRETFDKIKETYREDDKSHDFIDKHKNLWKAIKTEKRGMLTNNVHLLQDHTPARFTEGVDSRETGEYIPQTFMWGWCVH